jgi:hypothetical protein
VHDERERIELDGQFRLTIASSWRPKKDRTSPYPLCASASLLLRASACVKSRSHCAQSQVWLAQIVPNDV